MTSYEDNGDPALYSGAWENPQALAVYDSSGAVVSSGSIQQGASAVNSTASASAVQDPPGTIVVIAREAGTVTVRTNYELRFSGNLLFFAGGGDISGVIAKGSVIKGRDKNKNDVPDVLEHLTRNNSARFVIPRPTGTRPDDK